MEQGETEIVAEAEKKRKRLLCVYSIYAKRDGVNVPPEYRVRMLPALRYLRKNVSDQKYAYYLAQLNPRYACYHEYLRRIGKAFSATQKHSEKSI